MTPISTATLTAGPLISAGDRLTNIAITPDGRTAYVLSGETGEVIPISTADGRPGAAISAGGPGAFPTGIAITPDGKTAYVPVTVRGYEVVIPIDTAANTAGQPIRIGTSDAGGCDTDVIAITPNGKTAYVTNYIEGTVVPISTATNTAGRRSGPARAPHSSRSPPTGRPPTSATRVRARLPRSIPAPIPQARRSP